MSKGASFFYLLLKITMTVIHDSFPWKTVSKRRIGFFRSPKEKEQETRTDDEFQDLLSVVAEEIQWERGLVIYNARLWKNSQQAG